MREMLGLTCRVLDLRGIRDDLTNGSLDRIVFFAASPSFYCEALKLTKEIGLTQSSTTLAIVTSTDHACATPCGHESQFVHVLSWPLEALTLQQIMWPPRNGALIDNSNDKLKAHIARRLQTRTPCLVPVAERLAIAAKYDSNVLLTGETGTGKTFLAKLLHHQSPRSAKPFTAVPCGSIVSSLVESELFGHVQGAFTGAAQNRMGRFGCAGEGTILLDEVDALAFEQQTSLLRVVETGEYEPVGSSITHKAACRIIAASNRNLDEEVRGGRFRQDLYYRLNVMTIHVPPLRDRIFDIAPLVRSAAARYNTKFGKRLQSIAPEVISVCEAYAWPGNIRELENTIQQAVLVYDGPTLNVVDLPSSIQPQYSESAIPMTSISCGRDAFEKQAIVKALAQCNNHRSKTARNLGISRVTLYKKLKKFGLSE